MKRIVPDETWPADWKRSYEYDLEEVYGPISCLGYAIAFQNRQRHTFELLRKFAPPPGKLLDVAAAQGNFSILLAERGYKVTWNDLRRDMIAYVQLKSDQPLDYCPGNVFDLDFADLFDVVLITEVIEHVAHPDRFLEKVASMVKPGGVVVMTTPNGEYFRNPLPRFSDCQDASLFESIQFQPNSDGHIFLLHHDEIVGLAKSTGLALKEVRYFNNPLSSGFIKTEFLLRILPRSVVDQLETFSSYLPLGIQRRLCVHVAAVFQRTS